MRRTNLDSLRSCLCFQVFRLNVASDFNSLLARFHQAEIIIVKHLIQGRNNETMLGVEPFNLAIMVVVKTASHFRKFGGRYTGISSKYI